MFVFKSVWRVDAPPELRALIQAPSFDGYLTSCLAEIFKYRIDIGNRKWVEVITQGIHDGLRRAFPSKTFTLSVKDSKTHSGFDWTGGILTVTCVENPSLPHKF
jgi:hypothetical protein